MPLGLIILFALAAAIYFGLAQRVLDRMRLTDTQALLFVGLQIAGSFVNIPLSSRNGINLSINVGGAVVPVLLAIYLLYKASTTWEWVRALLAAAGTAVAIWGIAAVTDFGPEGSAPIIDPVWLYSLLGGAIAYLLGRSRRAAFVAGTLGVVFADLAHLAQVWVQRLPSTVNLGGAGVYDATVLAGVVAVALAELVGETRERLQGGPELGEDRPLALRRDEGVADEDRGGDKS